MLNEIKLAFTENKTALISATAILFISLILGYYLEPYLHSYMGPVLDEFAKRVESGVIELTFQSLFFNNIQIVFAMFIYGFIFCFSALILAFNGFFVGYFVATTENLLLTSLLIIPHGIFEFSSCIIACASGFVLFNFVYKFIKSIHKQDDGSVMRILAVAFSESFVKLKQAVILLIIASILMAIAGFVEAYLTLPIGEWIYSLLT